MFAWKRPDKPSDFDKTVADARRKIVCLIRAGVHPTSDDFEPKWSEYKTVFHQQQECCAFCDRSFSDHPDLDHYRPKAELAILDSENPGMELPGVFRMEGREKLGSVKPGYWWAAYQWRNYVLACGLCNRSWKRCFFPTQNQHPSTPSAPNPGDGAKPLLLDPYTTDNISHHLTFSVDGTINGKTDEGKATIATVALDRASLVQWRESQLKDVCRLLVRVEESMELSALEPGVDLKRAIEALGDIISRAEQNRDGAGVIRCFVEDSFELAWSDVIELYDLLTRLPGSIDLGISTVS